ncbi:TetR/AcrR family transcriptional regulator [Nocardia sp. NBC_00508]|uniref:TetR/AcrR family transcriptional regulator n=1 Tax=Nocardia sp. NBC_00508 TaxID=2975992 RepID=UPI002E81F1B9|nr:TetR/AcrR family transcriptional regulator [Nocardia sp. NBC_00508]WUD66043.1 TetR/AcrR family transcriptional regulator [Nocardia sp. NBC_00508]
MPGPLARRADARHNREKLLEIADATFRRDGVKASLAEIARTCGIAIGTLYKHFPTREALLQALIHDRVTSLQENAERLADSDMPCEALIEWLQEFGRCASAYRGLAESILAAAAVEESDLNAGVETMRAAAGVLVVKAQKAGTIRLDVSPAEVFALACGAGTASPYATADPDRLLRLVVEGLATR